MEMTTTGDQASSNAIGKIFAETSNFVLIALTGRTGSGCSTAAQILASEKLNLPDVQHSPYEDNEARKYHIIKKYVEQNWRKFHWLQISTVITRYILQMSFVEMTKFLSQVLGNSYDSTHSTLAPFASKYDEAHRIIGQYLSLKEESKEEVEAKSLAAYDIYFDFLPKFSKDLKSELSKISQDAYTKFYQAAGNNIRSSGNPRSKRFDPKKIFNLPQTINKVIKSAHFVCKKANIPCLLVLDAIRNPYEAVFFKERYADFYLMSINTSDENRLNHLRKSHKFSEVQIEDLDKQEYPKKLSGDKKFVSQNIQQCIEFSDIHINNPRSDPYGANDLRCQLAWYVALILHPGLVMPTAVERCMQLAVVSKLNSGCISRQVGAVVTDSNYSVKAIGWNNSPQGQVPCLLRNAEDLLNGRDENAYSKYEKTDARFRSALSNKYSTAVTSLQLKGRNLSFCFKDLQNEVDNEKNQVHTRSLHAEENAFLQISKYGGQQLEGGILFTTASPCELCSKKSYQLGVREIVYIDPYPGIATEHTLSIGKNSPTLTLFRGAVGNAYHKIYTPLMPYKDELQILLDLPKKENKKDTRIRELESEISRLREELSKYTIPTY